MIIQRTYHWQLLLHTLVSTEPATGSFFRMHGNKKITETDILSLLCSVTFPSLLF